MQQESGVVISIRRCQSILLFNTSINKSDWCCGLLPPGTLSGRMGKCEGKVNFGREVPVGSARARPLPSLPALRWASGPAPAPAARPRPGVGGRQTRTVGLSPSALGSGRAELTQPGEIRSIFPSPHARWRHGGAVGGVHMRLEPGLGPPRLS